uniref:Uncharacterized protein n=1 Tax=uncultured organism MedDCM-OCT-S07-C1 TaxID=743625 RepID=D6PJ47_9ZZZZ|nr:hypothetical protein [uncultured organism MedDCM-OCT-S07-C1]
MLCPYFHFRTLTLSVIVVVHAPFTRDQFTGRYADVCPHGVRFKLNLEVEIICFWLGESNSILKEKDEDAAAASPDTCSTKGK